MTPLSEYPVIPQHPTGKNSPLKKFEVRAVYDRTDIGIDSYVVDGRNYKAEEEGRPPDYYGVYATFEDGMQTHFFDVDYKDMAIRLAALLNVATGLDLREYRVRIKKTEEYYTTINVHAANPEGAKQQAERISENLEDRDYIYDGQSVDWEVLTENGKPL